ncbi:MAG: hypothetical protein WDO15_26205 [Bacteroidota bacterium]
MTVKIKWATSEGFVVPQMSATLPQVEASTRILRIDQEILITKDNAQQAQDGLIAIDSGFFDVFPLEFISGDKKSAQKEMELSSPNRLRRDSSARPTLRVRQ